MRESLNKTKTYQKNNNFHDRKSVTSISHKRF